MQPLSDLVAQRPEGASLPVQVRLPQRIVKMPMNYVPGANAVAIGIRSVAQRNDKIKDAASLHSYGRWSLFFKINSHLFHRFDCQRMQLTWTNACTNRFKMFRIDPAKEGCGHPALHSIGVAQKQYGFFHTM